MIHFVRRPAKLHRMLYTSSMWTLAAVAGTLPYRALGAQHWSEAGRVLAALAGGPLYAVVNLGLLSLVMALSEGESVRAIWRERFRWTLPYYIVSGPLAVALVFAYERLGVIGLCAFALPPWFMMFSVHQYVARTRAAAEGDPREECAARGVERRSAPAVRVRERARRPRHRPHRAGRHRQRARLPG